MFFFARRTLDFTLNRVSFKGLEVNEEGREEDEEAGKGKALLLGERGEEEEEGEEEDILCTVIMPV